MKKQSQKHNNPSSEIEKKWEDEEEITVRRTSPVSDENSEESETAHFEAEQEAQDYKQLYEDLVEELKAEKENNLRKFAEVENFRKRLLKEKEELVQFATTGLLQDIFPSLDNMEMTLQHASEEQIQKDPVISGVNLVLKEFVQTLKKHGVEEIAGEGEPFDPNLQEAIGTEKKEGVASNIVTKVHRKGYKLHNRVLRAAMVTVSE